MPLCSSRRQPPLLPCRWWTPLGWPRPRRIGTPPGRMPPHTTPRFTQRGRSVPPAKKDQSLADSGKLFLPMRQGHIRRMSLLTSSPGSIGPVWATHASLRQVVGSSKPSQPSQPPLCLSRVSDHAKLLLERGCQAGPTRVGKYGASTTSDFNHQFNSRAEQHKQWNHQSKAPSINRSSIIVNIVFYAGSDSSRRQFLVLFCFRPSLTSAPNDSKSQHHDYLHPQPTPAANS